jgi:hypothetical protein
MKTFIAGSTNQLSEGGLFSIHIYVDNHDQNPSVMYATVYHADKAEVRERAINLTRLLDITTKFQ